MKNKLIYISILGIALGISAFVVFKANEIRKSFLLDVEFLGSDKTDYNKYIEEKKLQEAEKKKNELPAYKKTSIFSGKDTLNVLLIGIDRRSKNATAFNTDVLVLASVNTKTNRVLLTSVPRDLWINNNKINALYIVYGWETLKDAFQKITGQQIDGYIMCDFQDFKWLVDSFGGIPVDVERTFTDTTFPNNSDTGVITVTYTQGPEVLTPERALTFARSRHGDNGEGSDLMRAKRQHLMLKGMIEAVSQPASSFWPMDVEKFYNAVTATSRMSTTLALDDAYYLWDFYKDRENYQIESFIVGGDYVYHPTEGYKAWVFAELPGGFAKLAKDIVAKLDGTFVDPNAVTTETQP